MPEAEIKADADALRQKRAEGLVRQYRAAQVHLAGHRGRRAAAPKLPKPARSAWPPRRLRWDSRMEECRRPSAARTSWAATRSASSPAPAWTDPPTVYQMIADTLGEMSKLAEKEKVYLLLENEGSQNIATAQELADVMKMIPSKWVGFNWDPHNAYGKEKAYPDGYAAAAQGAHAEPADQGQGRHARQSGKRGLARHFRRAQQRWLQGQDRPGDPPLRRHTDHRRAQVHGRDHEDLREV